MDFMDRFFGRGTPTPGGPPVANARLADAPGFILLFSAPPALDAAQLAAHLRDYSPELAGVSAEVVRDGDRTLGLVAWGRHAVKVAAFDTPAPKDVVEACVLPAHYAPETKEAGLNAPAHAVLFYAGYDLDPYEQHVVLAAAAAGLTHFGGEVVVNERARTSVPARVLLPHEEDQGDPLRTLRTFPLPLLYAGFVRLDVEGDEGVWMRTCGCAAFHLPDLAFRGDGHEQTEATFNLFSNLLRHLRDTGAQFHVGDTLNLGEGMQMGLRGPAPDEWFLESDGSMLILERVPPGEVAT